MIALVLLIVAIVTLVISVAVSKRNPKRALHRRYNMLLSRIPNFKADKVYREDAGLCMIAIDVAQKKVLLSRKLTPAETAPLKKAGKTAVLTTEKGITFADILKTELIIDGQTISTRRAGSSTANNPIAGAKPGKEVTLKLWLTDRSTPPISLVFFQKGISSAQPIQAQKDCRLWQEILFEASARA